jgi:MarR family transcriptional repressor of mepA
MKDNFIGFRIIHVSHQIKRAINHLKSIEKMEDLTGTQGKIIGYLVRNLDKDIFQKDIEDEFSIRRSTATGILQLMEKNDLVRRVPTLTDKRLKKIILTEKSLEINKSFSRVLEKMEKDIEMGLTPDEIAVFFNIMEKIQYNINNLY